MSIIAICSCRWQETISMSKYRKIPKISPSKYKPPRGLVLGNCPQVQSKTKKNGKFPTKNKASLIDF